VVLGWGPGEDWPSRIDVWEPNVRLVTSSEMPGADGRMARLAVEFRIETDAGGTRVRLVHSGFGGDGSWDDMIDGLEAGWAYFMANLRHCLERHPDIPRTLLSARAQCAAGVDEAQRVILGGPGLGLEMATGNEHRSGGTGEIGPHDLVAGRACALRLGNDRLEARILVARPPRTVTFVIPALGDAMLFLERETLKSQFRLGIWLSVYGLTQERCDRLQRDVADLAARISRALPTREEVNT
jgi:hypothetical protein